jgi:hypothetical protein
MQKQITFFFSLLIYLPPLTLLRLLRVELHGLLTKLALRLLKASTQWRLLLLLRGKSAHLRLLHLHSLHLKLHLLHLVLLLRRHSSSHASSHRGLDHCRSGSTLNHGLLGLRVAFCRQLGQRLFLLR